MAEIYVGEVIHYFPNINVAVITLVERLDLGDIAHFKSSDKKRRGIKVDFEQKIDAMEIEHKSVSSTKTGGMVAIKVNQKLRSGDRVYKKAS